MQTTDSTRSITDPQLKTTTSHAIVIGGSMAGLLAARVLAAHFGQVTLVDRDRFPDEPGFRKGVPQSRHIHVLLDRGRVILEDLFPGFEAEMAAAGAVSLRWPKDILYLTAAGWCDRFETGLGMLCASRELLEWTVRRRVTALPNVIVQQDSDVTGILTNAARTTVAGVQVRARNRTGETPTDAESLTADLVVDASGRNSRAPKWLQELGYATPEETMVNAFLGYASRVYAIPKDFAGDWRALILLAKPPAHTRWGALAPLEGDRWMVTVAGAGRDYPPTEDAGFVDFARSLRSPILAEAIRDAEPLGPIFGYQRTENQLRHFERLPRLPEGFLVTGDAACALNPVYGQGMTVAACASQVLSRCLVEQRRRQPDGDLTGLARRFQRQVAKSNAAAWLIATGEDARYPTTEGGRLSRSDRLVNRYIDRVMAVSMTNQRVNRAFEDVTNLSAPPTSLFRPGVLIPVLRGGRAKDVALPPTMRATAPSEVVTTKTA